MQEELKAGHFRSVEEVIGEALQVLREKEKSAAAATSNGTQGEACGICWRLSKGIASALVTYQ